jgi:hypothetical protein
MTAARRLAAILAADVVGYSRLMGEDEAGTGQPHSARLKSGMLACSYLHALNAGDGCSATTAPVSGFAHPGTLTSDPTSAHAKGEAGRAQSVERRDREAVDQKLPEQQLRSLPPPA